jgi:hypothetical protein
MSDQPRLGERRHRSNFDWMAFGSSRSSPQGSCRVAQGVGAIVEGAGYRSPQRVSCVKLRYASTSDGTSRPRAFALGPGTACVQRW